MTLFDVVVFDVDDTLYLERDYVLSGFRAVGEWAEAQLSLANFGDTLARLFFEGVRGSTFNQALEHAGVDPCPEIVSRMVAVYRSHIPAIRLLDDASTAMAALRTRSLPIAVITDGPKDSQRRKVRALGIDSITDTIIVTDEHGPSFAKPSCESYQMVERHHCRASRFVYVADNPAKDFLAPAQLGWSSVRIRRVGSLHESVPTPEGMREIQSLEELIGH